MKLRYFTQWKTYYLIYITDITLDKWSWQMISPTWSRDFLQELLCIFHANHAKPSWWSHLSFPFIKAMIHVSTSSHIWKLGFQGNINPLSLANYANYKMIYMPDWLIEMSEDCPNYQKLLLVSLSIRRWYLQVFLKMTITWFQKALTTMLLTRNFFILFSRELLELFRGGFTQSTYKHLILIF